MIADSSWEFASTRVIADITMNGDATSDAVMYSEETECRFCHRELPDWRAAYNLPTATPVMTVCHNNVQHLLHVKPGDAGKTAFEDSIRRIFGLGPQDIIQLEFGCKAPGTGVQSHGSLYLSKFALHLGFSR